MVGVRGIPRHQARLADKKCGALNVKGSALHAAQPLTHPKMGCKWLCVESSRGWGGYVIGPLV